jgi:2-iminobutanoate/2-iminopropanoate deaminase
MYETSRRIAAPAGGLTTPAGPYSHAALIGALVAVSGQVGIDASTGQVVSGGVGPQVRQALANLHDALRAADSSPELVLRVGVYLTRQDDFAAMNEVYSETFRAPFPARTTIYVGLPAGLLVEIDALAIRNGGPRGYACAEPGSATI